MRPALVRRMSRRLPLSQPLVRHRALHSFPHPSHRPGPFTQHGRLIRSPIPRRTFFGLFQKKQGRDLREPLLGPGMEKMLELDKRVHLLARLPPPQDLVVAFRAFVQSMAKRNSAIEDFHATRLLQTLEVLEHPERLETGNTQDTTAAGSKLSQSDLAELFGCLYTNTPSTGFTEGHNKLVKATWEAFQARHTEQKAAGNETSDAPNPPSGYLRVLCSTGEAATAAGEVEVLNDPDQLQKCWTWVAAGFAREDNEKDMLQALDTLKAKGIEPRSHMLRTIAVYYARKNDVEKTKEWFTQAVIEKRGSESTKSRDGLVPIFSVVLEELLQFCMRNDQMQWGQELLQSMSGKWAERSEQETWNAVFQASAATGKSIEDIDRMITVMTKRADEAGKPENGPTVALFNGLIKLAISQKDFYRAERYFNLMSKWDQEPDAESYMLQIEYRLLAEDIDGAVASYNLLETVDVADNEDWPIVNRLVQELTARPNTTNDLIMDIAGDLSERRKVFPSETILALCRYHLDRDEYFEIVDLLQTYVYQFSIADRLKIRDLFVDYTLDPDADTGRAWDTYMIFHQVFDLESKRDLRTRAMTRFFDSGRPDLGTHVFQRMSQHMRQDTQPDEETYVRAFEGIGKTGEEDALEIIHNLLKLDVSVEPSTRIYNGLMMAYTACGEPNRALDFWREIAMSNEGPTFESLHIAFFACQFAPFGYQQAMAIWSKLRQADIEISPRLFAAYLGALSGNKLFDVCYDGLRKMKDVTGYDTDLHTFAMVYNGAFGVNLQNNIENWCKENYPKIWEQAEEKGIEENDLGIKKILGIDRGLKA